MPDGRLSALVVDDNPGFLRVVRAILEEPASGFVVHTAKSGGQAIAWLKESCAPTGGVLPAFIVLDFHLPDMDAPLVLRALREDARTNEIPVLVVSQDGREENESRAMAAGARAFRAKPSCVRELKESLVEFWRSVCDADVDSLDRGPCEDGRAARADAVGGG